MPELPEVETVKRTLLPLVEGRSVVRCVIHRSEVIKYPSADVFTNRITSRKICGFSRRGKYLCLHFDDGQILVVHLRMTGRFMFAEKKSSYLPHTHVVFVLDDENEIRFSDTRRFGCLWLLAKDEEDTVTGMAKLGPEPFDEKFCADYLREKLCRRRVPIKNALLDQSIVAGLGNIYADETLFAAGVLPQRLCCFMEENEWLKIADAIPNILAASIENRGTTFNDFLDGTGKEGGNMPFLQVYGRGGMPCKKCGTPLEKRKLAGRSTSFCPVCQK